MIEHESDALSRIGQPSSAAAESNIQVVQHREEDVG